MTSRDTITAGIVGFGYEGYSRDVVDEITKRVASDLQKTGLFDLRPIPKVQNYEQGQKAIEAFSAKGCDLLIGVIASWLDARGAMPFLIANRQLPILLYSTGALTRSDGVLFSPAAAAGAPGLLEPLRAAGVQFEYIYEPPDSTTQTEAIIHFARAAHAVNALKTMRLGSMGMADMGLYATNFDNTVIRNVYGVSTDFFDMLEVEQRIPKLDPKDVDILVQSLKRDWHVLGQTPKDETYRRIAGITLAIKQIVLEKKLTAVSLKCVEGMMMHMACAPCMVGTLLGDETYFVCECDVPGMLGHVILHSVSGEVATFAESYEFWHDRVLFGVCGFLPPSLIEGQKQAKLFVTTPWEGLMNCSRMRPGRVTLIRPFFRTGEALMHMVTGEAAPAREWLEIGFEKPGMHPSVEIILDGTMKHFVDHVPSQHVSLVYGDWSREVEHLCKLLGVKLVFEARR